MGRPRLDPVAKFQARLQPRLDGCWDIDYAHDKDGYARMDVDGKWIGAHVFAYRTFVGPVPEGPVVRHSCDYPGCVNPKHLEAGTPGRNIQDKVDRGRQAKGAGIGVSKLTAEQVRQIRIRYARTSVGQVALAEEFGVAQSTIWSILSGKTWRHVK